MYTLDPKMKPALIIASFVTMTLGARRTVMRCVSTTTAQDLRDWFSSCNEEPFVSWLDKNEICDAGEQCISDSGALWICATQ